MNWNLGHFSKLKTASTNHLRFEFMANFRDKIKTDASRPSIFIIKSEDIKDYGSSKFLFVLISENASIYHSSLFKGALFEKVKYCRTRFFRTHVTFASFPLVFFAHLIFATRENFIFHP